MYLFRLLRNLYAVKTPMLGFRLETGTRTGGIVPGLAAHRAELIGQTGAVTARAELTRRAQAHGVAVSYTDWQGRVIEVTDDTLAAVLGALDDDGGAGPPGRRLPAQ